MYIVTPTHENQKQDESDEEENDKHFDENEKSNRRKWKRKMVYFISPPFGNWLSTKSTISIRGSFTLYPREGLLSQIVKTLRYNFILGGWTNEIGLRNSGIKHAIATYKKGEIISIGFVDSSIREVIALEYRIPEDMDIELNVSCPNVDRGSSYNSEMKRFLNDKREWCIVKMSPLSSLEDVKKYYDDGFRQFHLSNTVPLNHFSDPKRKGGVSGDMVKECNHVMIPVVRKALPDVTIVGGGGIQNSEDIELYKSLGADHYSFSTVHFNPLKAVWLHFKLSLE